MTFRVQLGAPCKDMITGFEGVCVGRVEWLYGCNHVIVEPVGKLDEHGAPVKSQNFDEQRIEILPGENILVRAPLTASPGGPHAMPARQSV